LTSPAQYRADITSLTEKKPLGESDRICGHVQFDADLSSYEPIIAKRASLNRLWR